jgi:hypothetical protein
MADKAYVLPSKRVSPKNGEPVTLTESDFPSFGDSPREIKVTHDFKQTILNLIEKDQLDELERNKGPIEDRSKMSRQELEAAGWAVLPIRKLRENCLRFNTIDFTVRESETF